MLDAGALRSRSDLLWALRSWMREHGYMEMPTPVLVPATAVEEHLHPVRFGARQLRTSPEFALKRALAAGLHRVYELGPCMRAEEEGPWHAEQFLMLEWYRAGANLEALMDEVESLVDVAARALGQPCPTLWTRTTVGALFEAHTGIDVHRSPPAELSSRDTSFSDAFCRRWVEDIEPALAGPMIIADWPESEAALSEIVHRGDVRVARRFEVFIDGVELANAYQELCDPEEHLARLAIVNRARVNAGREPHPSDPAFLAAVGRMPMSAGIAVGVDRLQAALCGQPGIGRTSLT
jgi:elongation factor P--(R)-beta-lysine ligase